MRQSKKKFSKLGALALASAMALTVGAPTFAAFAADGKTYTSDVNSYDEALRNSAQINKEIAAEGFTLLKNKDKALPLAAKERNVTLLGGNSYSIQDAGGGSGAMEIPDADWKTPTSATVFYSLDKEGFNVNPTVKALYGNGSTADREDRTYMTKDDEAGTVVFGAHKYTTAEEGFLNSVESSFTNYGDVAIINIMRSGAEGSDNSANVASHSDSGNTHYQTLNNSERQLFAYAKQQKAAGKFKKVVVLINSPSVMEVGDLIDDDAIDSILWIGVTGWNGAEVIPDILTGKINPSGHVVDFWMRDFKTDPTWYNFGNYYGAKEAVGAETSGSNPTMVFSGSVNISRATAIDYAEGIYVGYKYYETVAADIGGEKGEEWYKSVTAYPFGYGLSYTTFTQEIKEVKGDLSKADGEVTVTVTVKNTGDVAGKDVVQLYSTPEYKEGEIEKAAVNLVGFAKTSMLAAGASEDVNITIAVKDLASFDYNDANGNEFNGYELEKGKYVLSIRSDSHTVLGSKELTAAADLNWDEDGNAATPNNIFSQEEGVWEMYNTSASHWTVSGDDHQLHRYAILNEEGDGPSDLTKLVWLVGEDNDNTFSEKAARARNASNITVNTDFDNFATADVETDYANVWTKTDADVAGFTQGTGKVDEDGLYAITIGDMLGVDYNDPKWDALLNQLTMAELKPLAGDGGYHNAAVPTIGKPLVEDSDGPGQLKNAAKRGWGWVGEIIIAATWNVDLAEQEGRAIANEALWNLGLGWYGPAMNFHRSPLAGRNFEYYSQDGIHNGLFAAAVVKGCVEAGGRVFIKHAFLNDQETSRSNVATFCNEQALREIYAKPFELAIKLGKANGVMSSFNLHGLQGSANYATNIQLYTNEWGYKGETVTDFYASNNVGWGVNSLIRGCVFPLTAMGTQTRNIAGDFNAETGKYEVNGVSSPTQWFWLRETAKRILYTYINSGSGLNGFMNERVGINKNRVDAGIHINVGHIVEPITFVDTEYLTEFFGEGNFEFWAERLPAGFTIDPVTGAIYGVGKVQSHEMYPTGGMFGQMQYEEHNYNTVAIHYGGKGNDAWIGGYVEVIIEVTDTRKDEDILQDLYASISKLEEQLKDSQNTNKELEAQIAALLEKIDEVQKAEGPAGPAGPTGPTGPVGPAGPTGPQGEAGSGCGGNIASTAAIAGVSLALVAAGVVVARKRKANK